MGYLFDPKVPFDGIVEIKLKLEVRGLNTELVPELRALVESIVASTLGDETFSSVLLTRNFGATESRELGTPTRVRVRRSFR